MSIDNHQAIYTIINLFFRLSCIFLNLVFYKFKILAKLYKHLCTVPQYWYVISPKCLKLFTTNSVLQTTLEDIDLVNKSGQDLSASVTSILGNTQSKTE